MKTQNRFADLYSRVTDSIVNALESGTRPWIRPWNGGEAQAPLALPLRACGTPYQGVNVLLLWDVAQSRGYASRTWMTFKQAERHGAHVRKGEHGAMVVYADRATKTEVDAQGEEYERSFAFLKSYTVFNTEQIEGLPEHFSMAAVPSVPAGSLELSAEAERFFARTGARIRHGGGRAFYSPSGDFIQLPQPEMFRDAESYAATKAHELVHWTGHGSRLAREFGQRFGDRAYAFEELVAELGAAFLCSSLGLVQEPRDDHASYLATWLAVLKEDKRAIFTAAAHAQRASDLLHGQAA
jgi:antirestriction protein ArdC